MLDLSRGGAWAVYQSWRPANDDIFTELHAATPTAGLELDDAIAVLDPRHAELAVTSLREKVHCFAALWPGPAPHPEIG